jgi:hypothetical protein
MNIPNRKIIMMPVNRAINLVKNRFLRTVESDELSGGGGTVTGSTEGLLFGVGIPLLLA